MNTQHAVRSTRVVAFGGVMPASIVVEGETIADVVSPGEEPAGCTVRDVGDALVMPGVVDTHVHVNEPGRTEWEGFDTATRAAAAGGVTTIVDMPLNSIPAVTDRSGLDAKLAASAGRVHVDCAFWGGVVPGNADQLSALVDAGVRGFKCFLADSGVPEFPKVRQRDLSLAMPIISELGVPLLVHAELTDAVTPSAASGDERRYSEYEATRPPAWERAAVRMLIGMSEHYGCRVHIVHVSHADTLQDLRAARLAGIPVSAETCPHYLTFCAEEVPDGATEYKCAPPIRDGANRSALRTAVAAGEVDTIGSDHSPCPAEMKLRKEGDFIRAWGGIASLQFTLPALLTGIHDGDLGVTYPELTQLLCTRPAALAGLAHRKGSLAPGMDADLVAVNTESTFTVTDELVLHRHSLTPYRGRQLRGVVELTLLRGRAVYHPAGHVHQAAGTLLTERA